MVEQALRDRLFATRLLGRADMLTPVDDSAREEFEAVVQEVGVHGGLVPGGLGLRGSVGHGVHLGGVPSNVEVTRSSFEVTLVGRALVAP